MSFLLKTVLLFLKTSSAIIEGVQSILQNICDVIESTFKTRLSTALMKDKSIQSNFQATDNYISNAKPSLLIFNLKQNQKVTITYGDADNFLGISLSTELETRVQPIGNKMDKYNTSKPHSEDVRLHSDSSVAASNSYSLRNSAINEVEDSKIQTEVMGKSTTSEGTVRNICLNTKDQMSKTEEHVKSFGCSSDEETGGLREILPSSNSSSGSVDALRPKKSLVAIRTRNGKSQSELRSRTAGIKRKHLKNNGLDDCTISPTSEENKRVVSYIPLKRLNLEKTVLPDSSTRTYRNLEHITSLESKSLTEIPSPHKMDSCIGVKSNSFCIDSLCSANINQDVICKDKPVILLTPCVEFEDSTSGTDSHNVKINQNNMVDCRSTLNRKINGEAGLLKDFPLVSTHDHASREARYFFSTRKGNMVCPCKESALECRGIKEMVRNLIREHFEMGHRSDSGKRQKTSVTETVRNSGENKYQVPITACKEQTKVKIIEEDKNSELEVLNNSGEEYIRQELEKLSKIAAENVQISKNLSKKTEEEGNISCTDLPTVAEECVETVAEECVETVAEECVETVAEECVETVAEECVETVAEECVETVAEECVEMVAEECVK